MSRVVVNATAIGQAVTSCQQDIEQIVGDVCKGATTADLAVTASAQAVAKVSRLDPGLSPPLSFALSAGLCSPVIPGGPPTGYPQSLVLLIG